MDRAVGHIEDHPPLCLDRTKRRSRAWGLERVGFGLRMAPVCSLDAETGEGSPPTDQISRENIIGCSLRVGSQSFLHPATINGAWFPEVNVEFRPPPAQTNHIHLVWISPGFTWCKHLLTWFCRCSSRVLVASNKTESVLVTTSALLGFWSSGRSEPQVLPVLIEDRRKWVLKLLRCILWLGTENVGVENPGSGMYS